jgi:hypothetical protein
MSHFAKVENGIVTQVIVAEQDFIDSGHAGDPGDWVQTSYNTRGGVHYGQDGNPDGGLALRLNYAGIGYIYDAVADVFYRASPYPSWLLNTADYTWQAPVPYPADENKHFAWNEDTQSWDEILDPIVP